MTRSERNPYIAVIAFNDLLTGGFPYRTLKSRGIGRQLISREATETEIAAIKECWREISYYYKTLEGLISDERTASNNEEWLQKIIKSIKP